MGVPYLHTFLKNKSFSLQSIKDAANEYRVVSNLQPCLLIDKNNFLTSFYQRVLPRTILGGGESKAPMKSLKAFIAKLQMNNIKVVFVDDGIHEYDIDQVQDLEIKRKITLKAIKKYFRDKKIIPPHLSLVAYNFLTSADQFLQKEELIYKDSNLTSMAAIQKYVNLYGCFGVMSGNSDLFMCQNMPPVFSPYCMSLKKSKFWCIKTEDVSKALQLSSDLFPMFATLCGNNIVKVSYLKDFHKSLMGSTFYSCDALFQAVLTFLNNYAMKHHDLDTFPEKIAKEIGLIKLAPKFRKSVKSYSYNKGAIKSYLQDNLTSSISWNSILTLAYENHPSIFNIMTKLRYTYELGLELYDDRQYPCDILLTKKQFRRYYGHLFAERRQSLGEVEVLEHTLADSALAVTPEYPGEDTVISLLALWGPDCDEDLKWKAFSWIVDPQLNPSEVMNLPRKLFIPAMAVYLMCFVDQFYSEDWVADTLVTQAANMLTASSSEVENIDVKEITDASIHIASVYMRICESLYRFSEACGIKNPENVEIPCFEPRMYHYVRVQIQNGDSGESLCKKSPEVADGWKKVTEFLNRNSRI